MERLILVVLLSTSVLACQQKTLTESEKEEYANRGGDTVETTVGPLILEAPFSTESVTNRSEIIDWPEGDTPKAPKGFSVTRYAENLDHPRWTYIAPNKDVFVAESDTENSANQITLLRDSDGDGEIDEQHVFLENLNQNFGMMILDGFFYVANTDGLYRYPYNEGETKLTGDGEKILDLSASGYNNHWTRNIITNKEKNKIYVSVGSASNVGEQGMEKEKRRANILEINLDGSGEIIYADGLRNPVGMDFNPVTGELWTAVNERDKLGDNLVPDYVTSVKKGGWYGWPYSYYGQIKDPRWKDDPHEGLVAKAIVPDVPVGNHTASLGLTFYESDAFPDQYHNGAFVGQHGSWNRDKLSGYKVLFIPFENGKPKEPIDFLTGFIANEKGNQVYGRPVCVAVSPDGSLLVNDDDGGVIWKVSYNNTSSSE